MHKITFCFPAIIISAAFGCGIATTSLKKDAKTPVNAGKILYNLTPVTYAIDTVVFDDDAVIREHRTVVQGLYCPATHKVTTFYLVNKSKNARLQKFCDETNAMAPLTLRHEQEHARKMALVGMGHMFPDLTRGEIAATNEIVAPAAEIIAAVDWRCAHGAPIGAAKKFVRNAEREIYALADSLNLPWPIDFNQPAIAEIVMKHAMARFTSEFNRGQYVTTVRDATRKRYGRTYPPNNMCDLTQIFNFMPQYGLWAPMWEFESNRGRVNIWNAVSEKTRRETIFKLESFVICAQTSTGKKPLFLENQKIH